MDNRPCKNCGSIGGNVGCDVCGPPIRERKAQERLARTPCCALMDALSDVLPQHAMACVSRLNLHDKPWAFDVTDDGQPLITRQSCQCSGESMRYLRGLLPVGHPKGFSHNNQADRPQGGSV